MYTDRHVERVTESKVYLFLSGNVHLAAPSGSIWLELLVISATAPLCTPLDRMYLSENNLSVPGKTVSVR